MLITVHSVKDTLAVFFLHQWCTVMTRIDFWELICMLFWVLFSRKPVNTYYDLGEPSVYKGPHVRAVSVVRRWLLLVDSHHTRQSWCCQRWWMAACHADSTVMIILPLSLALHTPLPYCSSVIWLTVNVGPCNSGCWYRKTLHDYIIPCWWLITFHYFELCSILNLYHEVTFNEVNKIDKKLEFQLFPSKSWKAGVW